MVGAILHGGGLGGGHYRAVVRRNNKWWLCNDSTVHEIAEEYALILAHDHGYVIAYNKVP
jgi:ubiquitin C-terminal hydrolase